MSRENAARRNRAQRKIRSCRQLPLEIKATLQVLLDCLSSQTNYEIAWPSAATIAGLIGRSVRTVRWHLQAIKRTKLFSYDYFTPTEAREYCQMHFGFKPNLDRCSRQAPTFYRVNESHWVWDTATKVTCKQDQELGQIVRQVLDKRNQHKIITNGQQATEQVDEKTEAMAHNPPKYDLAIVRHKLLQSIAVRRLGPKRFRKATGLKNDVDDNPSNVVNDTISNVVNNSQVLENPWEV